MKKSISCLILYLLVCIAILILIPNELIYLVGVYLLFLELLSIPIFLFFVYDKNGRIILNRIRGIIFCLIMKRNIIGLSIANGVKFQKPEYIILGNRVHIDHDAEFYPLGGNYPSKITVGDHVHIGAYNRFASKYEIKIEDNVLFAAYVHITDHSHEFSCIDLPVME